MGKGKRLRELRAASVATVQRDGMDSVGAATERPTSAISDSWYYIIRYVAIITMFADHLSRVLYYLGKIDVDALIVYTTIGRMAFPLFAFGLVESFYHTKDRRRHLLKIGILALISEIPFDMAMILDNPLKLGWEAMVHQNTCFTLFLGFLMLMVTDKINDDLFLKMYNSDRARRFFSRCLRLTVAALFAVIAFLLKTDYTWHGIALIAFLAFARSRPHIKFWQGVFMFLFIFLRGSSPVIVIPTLAVLALIYTAEIRKPKTENEAPNAEVISRVSANLCRLFYPLHFVAIVIVRLVLG